MKIRLQCEFTQRTSVHIRYVYIGAIFVTDLFESSTTATANASFKSIYFDFGRSSSRCDPRSQFWDGLHGACYNFSCGFLYENVGGRCLARKEPNSLVFSQGCQMAKFDPFLSSDCARVEGMGTQSKERKGSNFAA